MDFKKLERWGNCYSQAEYKKIAKSGKAGGFAGRLARAILAEKLNHYHKSKS